MSKPEGYIVYDIIPALDWLETEGYDVDNFHEFLLELAEESCIAYVTTEDCIRNELVKPLLDAFGTYKFTNRGGIDIYEVHIAV